MNTTIRLTRLMATLAVSAGVVCEASAQTFYWTNTSNTAATNWSNDASWSGGVAPGLGGSRDYTIVMLTPGGNATNFNNLGTAANNGFLLNSLVISNQAAASYDYFKGSNLVFISTSGGVAPTLNVGTLGSYNWTIDNNIVLSNSLTLTGGASGNSTKYLNGVVSGVGDITNNAIVTNCRFQSNANTFQGNWVLDGSRGGGIVQLQGQDAAIGSTSNGVTLMNGGTLQFAGSVTFNAARLLTIGPGDGVITAQAAGRTLTLTNAASLAGSGRLILGTSGNLSLSNSMVNFSGSALIGGGATAAASLTLAASNALGNASGLIVTNYGTVILGSAYGAGALTVTNKANSQTTLNAVPAASGGTRVFLEDLASVYGTDVRLNALTDGGNFGVSGVPLIIHADANGTGRPSGLETTRLAYGIAGNRGDMTVGDGAAGQWRGIGVGVGSLVTLGAASSNVTLNGNAELDALVGGTLTINSQITGGSAAHTLAIRGPGTVALVNTNSTFANLIAGDASGAGGVATLKAGHTTGTMTWSLAAGGSHTNVLYQNGLNGTLQLNMPDGNNTFNRLIQSGTAGGTLILNGGANSTNTGLALGGTGSQPIQNVDGGFVRITGGTWNVPNLGQNNTGAQTRGTNYLSNATLNVTGSGRYTACSLYVQNGGEAKFLADRLTFATEQTGSGKQFFLDVAEGGKLEVYANGSGTAIGGVSGVTAWINQAGGLTQYGVNGAGGNKNLTIGAAAGTSYYSLSGGRMLVAGTVAAGAGGANGFGFTGGTLAANAFTMANFAGNTLTNAGGVLAPGDLGVAGLTTITGNYLEATTNAVLAVDIGGTAKGSAFQTGTYDYLNIVNGTGTFSGRLSVSLLNGYAPPSTRTNFTVVAATGSISALAGGFANVADGKVWCTDGYSRFDVLFNTTAKTVILTNYAANAWSPTSGNAWDTAANWALATEPSGSAFGAYFGAGSSGTVMLDVVRTVRGLTFTNSAASYTVAGAGSLTLQGDALTAPRISVMAGSHTVSVPLALTGATVINVDGLASLLSLTGGITGGQAVTKTGTGTLALSGVNTLGALTVSAGAVRLESGTTTGSSLTIASGATLDVAAGTLYLLKGVAGGTLDTVSEVNAAITANTITLRGSNAAPTDFKVTEETVDSVVYVKVMKKTTGTMIRVL